MKSFFSRHRRNAIELFNKDFPNNTEIIRFKPAGMIGVITVTDDVAERMRKHPLFESTKSERGTFYENKPANVPEKNNIVQGPKGAGHVAMDDSTQVPEKSDEEKIATPPKKKKAKKKSSKKK